MTLIYLHGVNPSRLLVHCSCSPRDIVSRTPKSFRRGRSSGGTSGPRVHIVSFGLSSQAVLYVRGLEVGFEVRTSNILFRTEPSSPSAFSSSSSASTIHLLLSGRDEQVGKGVQQGGRLLWRCCAAMCEIFVPGPRCVEGL